MWLKKDTCQVKEEGGGGVRRWHKSDKKVTRGCVVIASCELCYSIQSSVGERNPHLLLLLLL